MAYIVLANSFHFPVFGSPYHFMLEEMLGIRENAVVLLKAVETLYVAFQLVAQEFRYGHDANASGGLRRRNNVFGAQPLE